MFRLNLATILSLLVPLSLLALIFAKSRPHGVSLGLPTQNKFLLTGEEEKFYMYTYRNFEGEPKRPWTAGKYGFVRTPVKTSAGVVYSQFHEGIDIRPIERDQNQNPKDLVYPVLPGKVVYVNNVNGRSNYGKYVVVEHLLPEGPFYSLYAHLNRVDCQTEQNLNRQTPIGLLGYTGRGINRERAHLHLEFTILCSDYYDEWKRLIGSGTNYHGNFNGLNLAGCDISRLLKASANNQEINLKELLHAEELYFKITIPRTGPLPLLERYPYLRRGDSDIITPSWELAFTASGFPLHITPSNRQVSRPTISWIKPTADDHKYHTISRISGSDGNARLTERGQRYLKLLTDQFPGAPTYSQP